MGKTKKVGIIARTLTCLMATAAIALSTASPAFAASEVTDSVDTSNISVTVPTTIPCTMMADGTVVAPSDLSIANSGDAVVMDAYTADAMGNDIDFTLDIGGVRALSRTGGKDVAPACGIDLSSGSTGALALKVSKLTRQSNAQLMDSAAEGAVGMVKLGFKFNLKELQGRVTVAGDASVGSTLTANVTGVQADAELAYQWYRGCETKVSSVVDKNLSVSASNTFKGSSFVVGDNGGELTFDPSNTGDYLAILDIYNDVTDKLVKEVRWGLVGEGYTPIQLEKGYYYYTIRTVKNPCGHVMTIPEIVLTTNAYSSEISGASQYVYQPSKEDVGLTLYCVVRDSSGKYSGELVSNPTDPVKDLPRVAFAVYSADDQSLSFYKRSKVPEAGTQFEGRTATEVYKGVEDGTCYEDGGDVLWYSKLWWLESLTVVDDIHPVKIDGWFKSYGGLRIDISKLHTERVIGNVSETFLNCTNLKSLDLSGFDTSGMTSLSSMFNGCVNLQTVKIGKDLGWKCDSVFDYLPTPDPSYISGADGKWYSMTDGKGYAPEDIPSYKADTYTAIAPEPPKFTGTVTFSPQAEVAEDRQTTTINISYTYSPRDAVAGIVKYEVADDANGLNAREVAIDKNVLQEPVWGKYMRITIADTSGKYEGSVDSGWIGRMATEFYGRAEITDVPQQGTRPGYGVTGPILGDGQSDLSCYDIRWEISDDASGLNARPHDELNAGRYLKTEDIGKYVRIVVSAKAPYSVHVPGSIASGWVEVRGHNGGDMMRDDLNMVKQDDVVGKVLISSKGEAVDE